VRVNPVESVLFTLGAFLFVATILGQHEHLTRPHQPGQFAYGMLLGPLVLAAFPILPALASLALRTWRARRRARSS